MPFTSHIIRLHQPTDNNVPAEMNVFDFLHKAAMTIGYYASLPARKYIFDFLQNAAMSIGYEPANMDILDHAFNVVLAIGCTVVAGLLIGASYLSLLGLKWLFKFLGLLICTIIVYILQAMVRVQLSITRMLKERLMASHKCLNRQSERSVRGLREMVSWEQEDGQEGAAPEVGYW